MKNILTPKRKNLQFLRHVTKSTNIKTPLFFYFNSKNRFQYQRCVCVWCYCSVVYCTQTSVVYCIQRLVQYVTRIVQDAPEDLLVSHLLKEHNYCNASRLQFNKKSGKYLPRTQADEDNLIDQLTKSPIDLEDLKYLKAEIEEQNIKMSQVQICPVKDFQSKF